jgi:hypothetical protein
MFVQGPQPGAKAIELKVFPKGGSVFFAIQRIASVKDICIGQRLTVSGFLQRTLNDIDPLVDNGSGPDMEASRRVMLSIQVQGIGDVGTIPKPAKGICRKMWAGNKCTAGGLILKDNLQTPFNELSWRKFHVRGSSHA